MKRILSLLTALVVLSGCSVLQNIHLDPNLLAQAAGNAAYATTISDEDIAILSAQSVAQLDAQNKMADPSYLTRLNKIMKGVREVNGLPLNFKVYKTNEINAFACGDGSIRVYSGLMDAMSDAEVAAIVGHEIGHVNLKHTKKAMKTAYLAVAARYALASAGGVVGGVAASFVGDLAQQFVDSKFSQKQEFQADEQGYLFSVQMGYDKYSMYNALNRLLELSGNSTATMGQKMFSSHPDTAERAARMKAKAESN